MSWQRKNYQGQGYSAMSNIELGKIDFVLICQLVQELTKLTVSAFRKSDDLQAKVTRAYLKQPGDKRIDRNPYNQLMAQKTTNIIGQLQQKQCALIYIWRTRVWKSTQH